MNRHLRYLGAVGGVGAIYWLAAKVGLQLAYLHGSVAALWPPVGVGMALLIMYGLSLWPGIVRTELMQNVWRDRPDTVPAVLKMATAHFDVDPWAQLDARDALQATESPRFTGRAVSALAADANVNEKTGRTLAAVLLADEYGFTDIDGTRPDGFCFRNLRFWPALAR